MFREDGNATEFSSEQLVLLLVVVFDTQATIDERPTEIHQAKAFSVCKIFDCACGSKMAGVLAFSFGVLSSPDCGSKLAGVPGSLNVCWHSGVRVSFHISTHGLQD